MTALAEESGLTGGYDYDPKPVEVRIQLTQEQTDAIFDCVPADTPEKLLKVKAIVKAALDSTDDIWFAESTFSPQPAMSKRDFLEKWEGIPDEAVRVPLGEFAVSWFWWTVPDATDAKHCRGCGEVLTEDGMNGLYADGCPCNNQRGINHGLVPENVCTCSSCDPERTGSVRHPSKIKFREFL